MDRIKQYKKDLRAGMIDYMANKQPGQSPSTYATYVSDSNYLLNNNCVDEYIRFMRSDDNMPEIRELIRSILVEKRGEAKATDGCVDYYYEKLCWHREYVKKLGGIDELLK